MTHSDRLEGSWVVLVVGGHGAVDELANCVLHILGTR